MIKDGWKVCTLDQICNIINGSTPLRSNNEYWDNGTIPWFTIDDIREQGRLITYTKQKVTEKGLSKLRLLPIDTVLLCCTASVGEYALTKIELTTNQQFNGLVIKNKLEVDAKYLMYCSSNLKKKLINVSGKTTIDFIAISKLKKIEVPIPPLPEQQAIVEKLDFAFDAIEKAKANIEKNIENAKELFQSKLNEIFSQKGEGNKKWIFKKLSDIFDVRDGTHDSPKYQESGFALVTSKNLKKGKITLDKIKFICEKDYININKRSNVSKGDILFAMIGTIGNPVVIVEEPDFAIKNVALIKSNKENNSYFFSYYLDLEMVIKKMQDESKGTTQRFVSLGYMRNFEVPCPKIEIQNKIVKQIDQLSEQTDLLQEKYKQKLANLEELKKSILEKAFKGELV